ncbi:SGNH/GDSL hydrolase family protein [soil metagenome]
MKVTVVGNLKAQATRAFIAAVLGVAAFAALAAGSDARPAACPAPTSAAQSRDGPTPYPADEAAWPGKGVIRTFGWMTDNRKSFWKRRAEDRCAVVFVGDSLIGGWSTLKADFPSLKVANRGIGGDVSRGVRFRLQEDVLDLAPKAVVLLVGTNDLSTRQDVGITASNIESIVDEIDRAKPGTPVVLLNVLPRNDPNSRIDANEVPKLNRLLASLATAHPSVTLVDTNAAFIGADGQQDTRLFKPDQLHLAPDGYVRLRDTVAPALAKLKVSE